MTLISDNLSWTVGQDNVPGIAPTVAYIPKAHISAWPSLVENPTNVTDQSTYSGDFTLVNPNVWKTIFADVDKSPVSAEPQGEKYAKSFLNTAVIKYPGTNEEATAFCRAAANGDFVFLVQERNSSKWRVIGSEMFQCDVNPQLNIGGAPTDDKGVTITITCTDKLPAPFYLGAIVTADGDINPSS